MSSSRVTRFDHHLPYVRRGAPVNLRVDGRPVQGFEGETVAALLLAEGIRTFRHTAEGAPRGPFCGMGVCYECLVTIDGVPHVRACQTLVAEGMEIETGREGVE
ncbi:MAG: (2Fe-2S)-binding protein [Anaerolineales bacterium]